MKQSNFKDEWKLFKGSFRVDHRFWFIMLWEVVFILSVVAGLAVFSAKMSSIDPMMLQAASQASQPFTLNNALMMQGSAQTVKDVQTMVFSYTAAILIYMLLVMSLFKSIVYSVLLKKRYRAVFSAKFLLAQVIWCIILFIIIGMLNTLFLKTLFFSLDTSAGARLTLFISLVVGIILFSYLTIMFFLAFTRTEKVWKSLKMLFWDNIAGIGRFLRPLFLTLLTFIALNIVFRFTNRLPTYVSIVVNAVILLAFITWLKIYYNACLERTAPEPAKQRMVREKVTKPAKKPEPARKKRVVKQKKK